MSYVIGAAVLVPTRDTTAGGSRLGKVEGVVTRVQVRRRDGTLGYYESGELEDAHHCWEPDCEACPAIAEALDRTLVAHAEEAAQLEERSRTVAWLRAQVNYFSNRHAQDLADKIERGEHMATVQSSTEDPR